MSARPTTAPAPADGALAVAAVDLGASSGRVMLGIITPALASAPGSASGQDATPRLDLVEARRFENRLAEREGHLSWDIDALWGEIRAGLRRAEELARDRGLPGISSIGVDSWAVDYVLVDPDGERIGQAIAYRDARTEGADEEVARRLPRAEQFARTGIAQQVFNTIHQLAVDERLADAPAGTTALLIPDAIAFLLTGARRTEVTNASTTGLLRADAADWDEELLAAAPADRSLLAPLVRPGERIGTVLPALAQELGITEVPVIAVCSHDTASAVAAVPGGPPAPAGPPVAYLSSGTWSLIGLELPAPVTSEDARIAGFTNEAGIDGTVRFLKNVTGMWLVSECLRQWSDQGDSVDRDEVLAAAAAEPAGTWLIDATDPAFLPPGRMAERIAAAARRTDRGPAADAPAHPATPPQIIRCILDSLALAYRDALADACRLAGTGRPAAIHVVGGGSRNALLNRLTAEALGIPVIAGPVEATALGNVAVQARALGAIEDAPGRIRAAVRTSVELETFPPGA